MKPSPLLALAHDVNVGWWGRTHCGDIFHSYIRALVHWRRKTAHFQHCLSQKKCEQQSNFSRGFSLLPRPGKKEERKGRGRIFRMVSSEIMR